MTSPSNIHESIEIFLRLEPDIPKLTHQNGIKPRALPHNRVMMYKTQSLKNVESKYISLLKQYAPLEPWKCPIRLTTKWIFRRPQNAKGWFKTTKPDTDNLIKTLKDCMKTAGYFIDDALVVEEMVTKHWADNEHKHGIYIQMVDYSEINQCIDN